MPWLDSTLYPPVQTMGRYMMQWLWMMDFQLITSEANNGLVHINLHLSGKSTNPANISFEINKTHNVTVVLQSTNGHDIKLVS